MEKKESEQFTVRVTKRLLKWILGTQYPEGVYEQKPKGKIKGLWVTRFSDSPYPDQGKGYGVWAQGLFVTDDKGLADLIRNLASKGHYKG